ncbi:YolD-like family protein [Psychrobacillus lasiicapitis]|uniref:YolD-like family protein n=1 Tax=Psychrobacillus lasiicapitis TaxID=1636719 RepID=A0A544TAD3_9BACI|nr:YolD-like family protein [Psychrobacillus lasiicapitis]TQR14415.1 YolD-like family protein [Psychrobacillus lasiicapitis]GGA31533.1 hypothetical protein GCM10011384_21330 [Psychrobacillus lasiicapitis]
MIRDRGMKKWQGMMLPEHVRLLHRRRENLTKVRRPELDEQELESLQEILSRLLKTETEADYKVWDNGVFDTHRGTITKIDAHNRLIYYINPFSTPQEPIKINQIVDITPV